MSAINWSPDYRTPWPGLWGRSDPSNRDHLHLTVPVVIVHFARGSDLVGLYINGKLVDEGYSMTPGQVLRHVSGNKLADGAIPVPQFTWVERWVDDEWLAESGQMPRLLEDVQWAS